jgi:type I restriction enzyme R subunit
VARQECRVNEADTCRKYVVPNLLAAGWDNDPHSFTEQKTFTDGRILVAGSSVRRGKQKRADYLLRYTRDFAIAIVEAKADYKSPGDGLQQAKDYAEMLGLSFAYSTNGKGILEFDYLTGVERKLGAFPSPDQLWARLRAGRKMVDATASRLLTPTYHQPGQALRYYQEIAVNRAVEAILGGNRRVLLTMATGTGKTKVAFQICWKLWNARWNRTGEHRKPKILYLADRNILVDDPKDKEFAPFGAARHKIENGEAVKSREMYFAIYQSIAKDERRPGLYKEYSPDFFDLIIVDECHRGSARDESNWREILEYFEPAYQLGMTATPLREDNRDTYAYFGDPIYTYSLRQGIEDGFLAPYRLYRIVPSVDATGYRPSEGETDLYGREVPDKVYLTPDFERSLSHANRTKAIAAHLAQNLKQTDRFAKTVVFCVDQEHAEQMRHELAVLNADLMARYPDYVCRVVSDEGDIGRGHLSRFQDVETTSPVVLTTSQMLTTGVDMPMVKNVALVRVVNSMTEFKQIIGRGTRVRDDYGKLYFTILDYTGCATRLFADPDFDGEPIPPVEAEPGTGGAEGTGGEGPGPEPPPPEERRKFYVEGRLVEIAATLVYELAADGKQLRVVKLTDYTKEQVRKLFPNSAALRDHWSQPDQRNAILKKLAERGIDLDELRRITNRPEADPFDLLCHVAFNAPVRTRLERADRLRKEQRKFFERFGPEARAILDELLDKYTEHGEAQFVIPDVLKVPPISLRGNAIEIARFFGGPNKLRQAVADLQNLLYAA